METLHDLGRAVREYVGGGQGDTSPNDESEMERGDAEVEYPESEGDNEDDTNPDANDQERQEDSSDQAHPLMFCFDCEATGLSIYDDHITKIAAKVVGVPLSTVSQPSFSSLVHTPRYIPEKGK